MPKQLHACKVCNDEIKEKHTYVNSVQHGCMLNAYFQKPVRQN